MPLAKEFLVRIRVDGKALKEYDAPTPPNQAGSSTGPGTGKPKPSSSVIEKECYVASEEGKVRVLLIAYDTLP